MSKHVATASAVISPKVKAGAWVGLALIVLQTVLTAVTPEMFAWAGIYSGLFYAAVTGLGIAVAAYLKGDPLRKLGGAIADMGDTYAPTPVPAPEPVELPEPDDEDDYSTADADALAARAAAIRQAGGAA